MSSAEKTAPIASSKLHSYSWATQERPIAPHEAQDGHDLRCRRDIGQCPADHGGLSERRVDELAAIPTGNAQPDVAIKEAPVVSCDYFPAVFLGVDDEYVARRHDDVIDVRRASGHTEVV